MRGAVAEVKGEAPAEAAEVNVDVAGVGAHPEGLYPERGAAPVRLPPHCGRGRRRTRCPMRGRSSRTAMASCRRRWKTCWRSRASAPARRGRSWPGCRQRRGRRCSRFRAGAQLERRAGCWPPWPACAARSSPRPSRPPSASAKRAPSVAAWLKELPQFIYTIVSCVDTMDRL